MKSEKKLAEKNMGKEMNSLEDVNRKLLNELDEKKSQIKELEQKYKRLQKEFKEEKEQFALSQEKFERDFKSEK